MVMKMISPKVYNTLRLLYTQPQSSAYLRTSNSSRNSFFCSGYRTGNSRGRIAAYSFKKVNSVNLTQQARVWL